MMCQHFFRFKSKSIITIQPCFNLTKKEISNPFYAPKKKLLYHFVNFQILTGFFKKSPTVFQNQNRKFEIVHVK